MGAAVVEGLCVVVGSLEVVVGDGECVVGGFDETVVPPQEFPMHKVPSYKVIATHVIILV